MIREADLGCCDPVKPEPKDHCGHNHGQRDYFYLSMILVAVVLYGGYLLDSQLSFLSGSIHHLFKTFFELMNVMSWGIALGVLFVGIIGRIPREYVISVLGKPGTKGSLVRATAAGLLLDLCNHGILLVGMKLYERGASVGQVMAFLIASPWNSFSLTIILVALIGIKWTLVFVALSAVIAFVSGMIFDFLVAKGVLPKNPNQADISDDFRFFERMKADLGNYNFSIKDSVAILKEGLADSSMIIKWIVFGALLSSVIGAFIDNSLLNEYFGPTLMGLGLTLVVTTVLEICSEGATPLAADLLNKAGAPGNSFTFLMAGVSTDYTEILSLRETTKSWKVALFLPLITVPQVLIIGLILNGFRGM